VSVTSTPSSLKEIQIVIVPKNGLEVTSNNSFAVCIVGIGSLILEFVQTNFKR
jgi:hypothetical protein